MSIKSLLDVEAAYQSAVEDEEEGKFQQGAILTTAIDEAGLDRKQVLKACADVSGQSHRLLRDRERVERIFVQRGKRAMNIGWSLHALCTSGCKIEDPATWERGDKWLEIAVNGRKDKRGNIRPHTYRTLKTAMKAGGDDPGADEPVFLLDAQPGRLWTCKRRPDIQGTILELFVPLDIALPEHIDIAITLVQAPAQEAA
jgi:hypothetical protein